jgi:hypothetical protein
MPVATGTHGQPPPMTDTISLPVHGSPSLLTVRYGPHLLQGGTRSSERACTQPRNALAGRADFRDASHKNCCDWSGGSGRGIPSTSWRASTRCPGGKPGSSACSWEECCPRGTAWSGSARPTGYHTDPSVQDRTLGPSSGRQTSRSREKPGEVARTFLLVNSAASLRWRRWRSAGRTSWPVSRIQTPPRPIIVHVVTSAARAPTASLRDGCATLAPAITTSKAARTRGRGKTRVTSMII